MVKSSYCSCRGHGFESQYPRVGLLPLEVPVDLTPSSGFHSHQACTLCTHIHVGKILTRVNRKTTFLNEIKLKYYAISKWICELRLCRNSNHLFVVLGTVTGPCTRKECTPPPTCIQFLCAVFWDNSTYGFPVPGEH